MSDPIQQDIEARGLNAPRVRPEDLEAEIASEWYFTGEEGALGAYKLHDDVYQYVDHNRTPPHTTAAPALARLTFCVLVLRNGITVTGQSACVSSENFDADIGRRIARENAVRQLWPLLGFRLADRIQFEKEVTDLTGTQPLNPCL